MSLIQINDLASTLRQKEEENIQNDDVSIGIDLGTSNSVISYYNGEKLEIIGDDFGELIPSVVLYSKNGVLVGKQALEEQADNLVFKSIKRFMGKSSADFASEDILYEFDKSQATIKFKEVQGNFVTPEEISSEILKYLKKIAEKKIGKKVKSAVITVPAYFDENQRIATKNSATLAGLEVLRLINEPTSAALAYGLDQNEDENLQGTYLVYDLGGGTFDISILALQKGVFKVLATLGDTLLGGDDIDNILYQEICKKANLKVESNLDKSKLLSLAKSIKEELSTNDVVNKNININNTKIDFSITKQKFEEKISDLVKKTLNMCTQAIADADLLNSDLKGIILVGGSTKIPYIQKQLELLFGIKPLCSINPDLVVAMGAGYKSAELSGKTKNSLLLDVIPLSLGLETAGGIVEKIIHRNTLIPIIKKQEFTTYKDNQTAMLIHILQGERELVKDLRSLGKFSLKGIPPMPAGVARVMVSFSIDADGLLRVEALESKTGIKQSVEIKPSWGLDFNSMRQIIEDGMENAEDDIKQRLLLNSKTEAQRVIDALEVALQEDGELLSEEYKVEVNASLENLIKATLGEDRLLIDSLIKKLDDVTSIFAGDRMNKKINKVLQGKKLSDIEKDLA